MAPIKIETSKQLAGVLENIDNKADENTKTVAEMQADIRAFRERLKSLTIAANSEFMNGSDSDANNRTVGNFIKSMARRGSNEVLEPNEIELLSKATPGKMIVKADLGTPLTNDVVVGSYLVPTEFHDEVLRVARGASEIIPRVRTINMNSRTKQVPVKNAGIGFTYTATDGADNTEANPTFTQETLTAYSYLAYVGISEALLEDDPTEIGTYFTEIAGEGYADIFDSEMLAGTGSPTTGLMADTGVQSVTMGAGATGFSDIDIDDFIAMEAALSEVKGALRNASWIMSPYIWNIVRGLKDANGNPVIAPWAQTANRTLLGYPVVLSYEMPESGASAADTAFVGFGNLRNLTYGDRIGLETKFYPNTQYAVTNCEAFFRFRFRGAFNVPLPSYFAVLSTAAA